MPPILGAYFKHHPASFPHPPSLIALIPLSVINMRNKKQKCSFQLQSPTPLITVASYFTFFSLLILPRLTLHALRPMDSIGCLQPSCSAYYISSWQSTARLLNSNSPKWHTVCQNKLLSVSSKTLHSCSLIMSSLRYYAPHADSTNSRILFSK